MIFSRIKTEQDLRDLKRKILSNHELLVRLRLVRSRIQYPKDGVRHDDRRSSSARVPSNAELLAMYREMVEEGVEERNVEAELAMRKIKTKSNSGVAVVSLLTKPFACPGRCTYCPTDVSMPKSYLAKEPAAARALLNDFDPYMQITNRLKALEMNGHPIDKIEMIVIGGTWSFYHPAYQEEFLIGCYQACNDHGTGEDSRTEPYADRLEYLRELQDRNERARCRIIGLSIETRPDYITEYEIKRLRMLGVTKVEVGVQHLDDAVLKLVKRDMTNARIKRATEMLRNAGFKVVYHMMPDLPGSTKERDISMFDDLFSGEEYQPDMLKIYPCMVLENSELYDTWKEGGYTPYSDEELIEVMREEKKRIPPYVRVLRVYRDIPADYIKAGSKISNLRQVMDEDMKKNGWRCRCIRCREIREAKVRPEDFSLSDISYRTKSGIEMFLSYENQERSQLASFIRLRLPDDHGEHAIFPVLRGAALIRELHTYGRHTPIKDGGTQGQHVGFGRRLLAEAERIAKEYGYETMAVISGIGVREYYRKNGYRLEGTYMIKNL